MSKTYAIADLHGRFDLLEKALARIADHATLPATLITLGDYVDRGPQSRQIIERLMGGLGHDGWTLVCLQGNHEQIMRLSCRELPHPGWWLQNGGGATLISYGHPPEGVADLTHVPTNHLDWVSALPLMHVDKHRIFVHAGVCPNTDLSKQTSLVDIHGNQQIVWKLYNSDDEGGHGERHVVHGHHQHAHGPVLKKGRTNLDTFAWYSGRLVVGVFDDDVPGGPVELLEVTGPTIEELRAEAP